MILTIQQYIYPLFTIHTNQMSTTNPAKRFVILFLLDRSIVVLSILYNYSILGRIYVYLQSLSSILVNHHILIDFLTTTISLLYRISNEIEDMSVKQLLCTYHLTVTMNMRRSITFYFYLDRIFCRIKHMMLLSIILYH